MVLYVSALFLLLPITIFMYSNKTNIYESFLVALLTINIILSLLFWTNPIKHSYMHFYDALFARISFIAFSVYILFIKDIEYQIKFLFLIILFSSFIMIYYSNKHSKQNWCSNNHIGCHAIFHFLISIGCCFAFIGNKTLE